jgi:ribose transport system substrate-binding protein
MHKTKAAANRRAARLHRRIFRGIGLIAAASLLVTGCSLKEPVPQSGGANPQAGAGPANVPAAEENSVADAPSLEGKTIGIAAKDIVHDFSRVVYEELQASIEQRGGKVIATQAEAKDDKHVGRRKSRHAEPGRDRCDPW